MLKFMIILILLVYSESIMIILNSGQEFCLHKDLKLSDVLKVNYIVSGENESSISAKLHGPFSATLFDNQFLNKGNFENEIQYDGKHNFKKGTYSLCFQSSSQENVVSFEFFSHNEGGHIVNIAKEGVFEEMNRNVTYISEVFEEIESNLKFYAERRQSHNKIITDLIDIIKNITIFKVTVILLVSLLQIFMIKRFFGNKKVDFNLSNPFSESKI